MPFPYNSTGVKVNHTITLLPEDDYILRIVKAEPGVTAKGDNKVVVDFEIAEGDFKLETIAFHNVTFFKDKESKAAGMAVHFLKCIGEPWENDFEVDEKNWLGKRIKAHVVMEMATQGKHAGKRFPRIKWVDVAGDEPPAQVAVDEVPF